LFSSDWYDGGKLIVNGKSIPFIMHNAVVVIRQIHSVPSVFLKLVVHLCGNKASWSIEESKSRERTGQYVVPVYLDVLISICPTLLMIKAQRMHNFVLDLAVVVDATFLQLDVLFTRGFPNQRGTSDEGAFFFFTNISSLLALAFASVRRETYVLSLLTKFR
jgi:hypothetical protein